MQFLNLLILLKVRYPQNLRMFVGFFDIASGNVDEVTSLLPTIPTIIIDPEKLQPDSFLQQGGFEEQDIFSTHTTCFLFVFVFGFKSLWSSIFLSWHTDRNSFCSYSLWTLNRSARNFLLRCISSANYHQMHEWSVWVFVLLIYRCAVLVNKLLHPLKYSGPIRFVIEIYLDLILVCLLNVPHVISLILIL